MPTKAFIFLNSAGKQKSIEGSSGGNGAADSGKPLLYDASGRVLVTESLTALEPGGSTRLGRFAYQSVGWEDVGGTGFNGTLWPPLSGVGGTALSASRTWNLPNLGGHLAVGTTPTSWMAGNVFIHTPATLSTSDFINSATSSIPHDNTIPQNTEGKEYMTLALTPKHPSSTMIVEFTAFVGMSTLGTLTVALFVDSTADALNAVSVTMNAATHTSPITLRFSGAAGSGSRTYKIRFGSNTGTAYMLRRSDSDVFSTAKQAVLTATEILP